MQMTLGVILGVHFEEDLKETILLNWRNTVTKMENHIQKMLTRHILIQKIHSNKYTNSSQNNLFK